MKNLINLLQIEIEVEAKLIRGWNRICAFYVSIANDQRGENYQYEEAEPLFLEGIEIQKTGASLLSSSG